jgi:uncharacterized protein with FMN-binding domain
MKAPQRCTLSPIKRLCNGAEVKAVRALPIDHVDLAKVRDGTYQGDFAYGGFDYQVQVTVAGHQIKQKNDVDAVSGATTTSKALLKAIERALTKGL